VIEAQVQPSVAAIRQIAEEVAARHVDEVDRDARFPQEAVDALREVRALSCLVPQELGGAGASLDDVATMCFDLGRCCGSTGMVFAMHQIQVASIARHRDGTGWFDAYLAELAEGQRLIASATSEAGTGGDMARSVAALTPADGDTWTFTKQAPTVSYGSYADDILVTLRRDPEAEPSDQVAVLARREQLTLEQKGTWDPFGMRGTCSPGFQLSATVPSDQVLPTPFGTVAAETMVPLAHILWAHVWLGVASDAFGRAHSFVRELAKQRPGETPEAATRLSHLLTSLSLLRAEVRGALRDFTELDASRGEEGATVASALRFSALKIAASEQAADVCRGAMNVAGIVGFKNDTPFSVGRHVRDAMSASLMIANDRIHQTNAGRLLIAKDA
jgi:acyl-CoA dehydrogenase